MGTVSWAFFCKSGILCRLGPEKHKIVGAAEVRKFGLRWTLSPALPELKFRQSSGGCAMPCWSSGLFSS